MKIRIVYGNFYKHLKNKFAKLIILIRKNSAYNQKKMFL